MKRAVLGLCVGAVVIAAAGSLALGADKEKKKDKAAATATASKDAMYTAGCPDPCSFAVQSHDKAEVVALLKDHAKGKHNMTLSDKDAEGMVKVKGATEEKK